MSFERLFGVKVEAFERIVDRLRPLWGVQALKCHTLKTEVRTTAEGRILRVSSAYTGSVHDFALSKTEPPLPPPQHPRFFRCWVSGAR